MQFRADIQLNQSEQTENMMKEKTATSLLNIKHGRHAAPRPSVVCLLCRTQRKYEKTSADFFTLTFFYNNKK